MIDIILTICPVSVRENGTDFFKNLCNRLNFEIEILKMLFLCFLFDYACIFVWNAMHYTVNHKFYFLKIICRPSKDAYSDRRIRNRILYFFSIVWRFCKSKQRCKNRCEVRGLRYKFYEGNRWFIKKCRRRFKFDRSCGWHYRPWLWYHWHALGGG